jgi:hypothetical protein
MPERIEASQMRRHWWIACEWRQVEGAPVLTYIRTEPRPIEKALEAAAQFDTWFAVTKQVLREQVKG